MSTQECGREKKTIPQLVRETKTKNRTRQIQEEIK